MKKARCIRVYQAGGYKDIVCEPSRSERKNGLTGFKLATEALMYTVPNGVGGHIFLKERSEPVGYLHNFPYKEEKTIESYRNYVNQSTNKESSHHAHSSQAAEEEYSLF